MRRGTAFPRAATRRRAATCAAATRGEPVDLVRRRGRHRDVRRATSTLCRLLERIWQALFHLAALATEEEGEQGCAAGSSGLAPLLGRRSVRWAQLSKAADGFGAAAREAAVAEAWALEELQQLAGGARDAARLLPKWAAAEREGLRAHLSSPLCRKPPAGLCPRVDGAGRALTLRVRGLSRRAAGATAGRGAVDDGAMLKELQALATAATAVRRRVAQLDAAQRARLDGLLRDRQPLLPTGAAQIGSGGPSPAGLAKRLGALAAEVRH